MRAIIPILVVIGLTSTAVGQDVQADLVCRIQTRDTALCHDHEGIAYVCDWTTDGVGYCILVGSP